MKIKHVSYLLKENRIEVNFCKEVNILYILDRPSNKYVKIIDLKDFPKYDDKMFDEFIHNPDYYFIMDLTYLNLSYFFADLGFNKNNIFFRQKSEKVLDNLKPMLSTFTWTDDLFLIRIGKIQKDLESEHIKIQDNDIYVMKTDRNLNSSFLVLPLYKPMNSKFNSLLKLKFGHLKDIYYMYLYQRIERAELKNVFDIINSLDHEQFGDKKLGVL